MPRGRPCRAPEGKWATVERNPGFRQDRHRRPEVRRHLGGDGGAHRRHCRPREPLHRGRGRRRTHRRAVRHGQVDRRARGPRARGVAAAGGPRNGPAAGDRRAGVGVAAGTRAAGPRHGGDLADGGAVRYPHGRRLQHRAHSIDRHRSHSGGDRGRPRRHHHRLPGHQLQARDYDPGPGRERHHGRCGSGRRRGGQLRHLHRRRRRPVGRPERGAGRSTVARDELRGGDRDGVQRREGAASARRRSVHGVRRADPRAVELSRPGRHVDSRERTDGDGAGGSSGREQRPEDSQDHAARRAGRAGARRARISGPGGRRGERAADHPERELGEPRQDHVRAGRRVRRARGAAGRAVEGGRPGQRRQHRPRRGEDLHRRVAAGVDAGPGGAHVRGARARADQHRLHQLVGDEGRLRDSRRPGAARGARGPRRVLPAGRPTRARSGGREHGQ